MSIKQNGGVFGRNPTFNDVTIEGQLTFDGDIDINSDLKVDGDLEVTGTSSLVGDLSLGVGNSKEPYIQTTNSGRVETNPGYSFRGNLNTGMFNPQVTNTIAFSTGGTERARISSAGNLSLATGNLVIDTSGKGIDFSATAGTGTSELLDDYEEGVWTPTDGSGQGLTFSGSVATYTKVGNMVRVTATFSYPSNGSGLNTRVNGLPFTTGGNAPLTFLPNSLTAGDGALIINGLSSIFFYTSSSVRRTNAQYSGATIYLSGVYYI